MAWISVLSREEALRAFPNDEGQVTRLWSQESSTSVNIIQVFSVIPELMLARMKFAYSMTFGGSGLGRRMEELIATQVSGLLGCAY